MKVCRFIIPFILFCSLSFADKIAVATKVKGEVELMKVGKNKFDISAIKSSPLIFKDNVIFSDDTGSIFSVTQKGKINWKINPV